MQRLIFRIRHHIAMWRYQRKHGKFGPAPF